MVLRLRSTPFLKSNEAGVVQIYLFTVVWNNAIRKACETLVNTTYFSISKFEKLLDIHFIFHNAFIEVGMY